MEKQPNGLRGLGIIILFSVTAIMFCINPQLALGVMILLAVIGGALFVRNKSLLYERFTDVRTFAEEAATEFGLLDDGAVSGSSTLALSSKSLIALPANLAPAARFWESRRIYTIKLPKETTWKADQSTMLISKLMQLGRIVLRIHATRDAIVWQLIDANEARLLPDTVKRAVRGAFLEAEVSDPEPFEIIDTQGEYWRRIDFYTQSEAFLRPSLRAGDIKKFDPLQGLVNSFVDLQERESVSYSMAFGGMQVDFEKLLNIGVEDITESNAGRVAARVVVNTISQRSIEGAIGVGIETALGGAWGERLPKYDNATMKACWDKYKELPPMRAFIVVEANSPSHERLQHFDYVLTFAQHLSTEFQKFIRTNEPSVHITNATDEQRTNAVQLLVYLLHNPVLPLDKRANILTNSEMAALWHLPHDAMTAAEIVWLKGKQVAAPTEFRSERPGVQLGINKPSNSVIYQPLSERTAHTLIVGKTGVGKTSLIAGLIEQDIRAGNGVAVIDPTGNLIRRVLQHGIPPEREQDVVILDVECELDVNGLTRRYPPPMSITSRPEGADPNETAFQFASVLGKLFTDIDQTRWMQTLEAALLTLAAEETPTLMDIKRVIQDASYRDRLLGTLDFTITQLWEDIQLSGGLDKASLGAIIWRLNHFTLNPTLRAITCHPNPLDMAPLIHQNKIILVSLASDENKLPETTRNILGAIILAQIQMAALGGAVADSKNKPFMLYIDEVQQFVASSLDVIARQARQKGLGLVVATQYAKSIAPKTLKALEGNIGTLVAFECDLDDAESAVSLMPSFAPSDLVNMGRFKAAVSMRSAENANRASFSLDPVFAPDVSNEPESVGREFYLRRKSVENYTPMSYDEVKSWLDDRYRPAPIQAQDDEEHEHDFGNPIST